MRSMLLALAMTITTATALAAQEGAEKAAPFAGQVSQAVAATDVVEREPVGTATVFDADVGTVYVYTVLEGDFGETELQHVWLRGGEEAARIPLTVRGPRWRTWSSKRIPPEWAGEWTVQVVAPDGQVLTTVDFTVGGSGS